MHTCVFGVGICKELSGEDFYISMWNVRSIKTFRSSELPTSSVLSEIVHDSETTGNTTVFDQDIQKQAQDLLERRNSLLILKADGELTSSFTENDKCIPFILSGSFNPLHRGHVGMLNKSASWKRPNAPCYFELSVHNADKPSLDLNLQKVKQYWQFQ